MFIDIDFADKGTAGSSGGGFTWGFGKRAASQEDRHVERITSWANRNPDVGIRVYRTAAGLRCLITNQTFEPTRSDTLDILRASRAIRCTCACARRRIVFARALRPSRGAATPPRHHGIATSPHRRRVIRGLMPTSRFNTGCGRGVMSRPAARMPCAGLSQQLGPQRIHPDVAPILTLHDRLTGVEDQRPLA